MTAFNVGNRLTLRNPQATAVAERLILMMESVRALCPPNLARVQLEMMGRETYPIEMHMLQIGNTPQICVPVVVDFTDAPDRRSLSVKLHEERTEPISKALTKLLAFENCHRGGSYKPQGGDDALRFIDLINETKQAMRDLDDICVARTAHHESDRWLYSQHPAHGLYSFTLLLRDEIPLAINTKFKVNLMLFTPEYTNFVSGNWRPRPASTR